MFLLILTLLVLFLIRELYWKRRNLPPGPFPLPLIGNILSLIRNQPGHNFHLRCQKEYGDIYTIWIATTPMVCIADLQILKETFVKDGDSYAGKYSAETSQLFRGGKYGLVDTDGDLWRDHRRFALHQLRDLGLGTMKIEERIMVEVEELAQKLAGNKKINIFSEFKYHVANVINQLLVGYRFEGKHRQEYDKLCDLLELQKQIGPLGIVLQFPWTKNIPLLNRVWDRMFNLSDEFFGFFRNQLEEHVTEIDYESETSTDYMEACLKEKRKREAKGDFHSFCNAQLLNVCFDLWTAALGTTTATLNWAIVYLLHNPHVQENLHHELDKVIGSSRPVSISDRNKLPYTQAVVTEIQRCLNLVVTNLPHLTTRDVEIRGRKIAKDTIVVAQIANLMYDEKVFPDHEKFDPERFIDPQGNYKKFSCNGELPSLSKTFQTMEKPAETIDLHVISRF